MLNAAAKHKLRSSDGTVIPFGSGEVGFVEWAMREGREERRTYT